MKSFCISISPHTAQALSAALTKIESYIPTTWVDYTEPDIDAEHLNHAEQAIMRVTVALNAAADVINALVDRVAKNEEDIGLLNAHYNIHFLKEYTTPLIPSGGQYHIVNVNSPQKWRGVLITAYADNPSFHVTAIGIVNEESRFAGLDTISPKGDISFVSSLYDLYLKNESIYPLPFTIRAILF